jgi:alkylation response protein AidB-like acyl-CoA dehydrogenase
MTFAPSQDAEDLRAVVRDFLDKRCTESDVRRWMESETGWDTALWTQLATELGLHGLTVPERLGGSDATPVELGVVFEEFGAALYGGPFLASIGLAASALLEVGGPDADALLPGIADGSTVTTLAWAGPEPAASTLQASDAGGWRISGTAPVVVDGTTADLVLVAAATPAGPALFAVAGTTPGLTRHALTPLDSTRRLAELSFDRTPARLIGSGADALRRAWHLGLLYLASEQLGGAARVLDMTVSYARTRIQFGRAIGSFSTIKHRCADLLVEVEAARSVVWHGLWSAVNDPATLPAAAALARAVASDTYRSVTTASVQIHGGIGFTWEHPLHLYLKRAKSSQLLFGTPSTHRAALAAMVGVTGEATVPLPAAAPAEDLGPAAAELDAAITAFLAAHPVPAPDDVAGDRAFREARFDAGLAMVAYPEGCGGRGLDPGLQPMVEERFLAAGAVDHFTSNVIGLGMGMATIVAHGTDEQKRRFLRPCFSGEEIYCQLFSEPGAGSDLAGLATRAVPDGDDFIVNGQKVWTSLAHTARRGILVARTDPNAPKHAGLTYFVIDMTSPGVEVRPLRQLTGEDEFNEVYLTDVRVPGDCLLGGLGNGWKVAMTTLANERVALGRKFVRRGEGSIAHAVRTFRAAAAEGRTDAASLEKLMVLWTQAEAARLTSARAAAAATGQPGPEGSIAKLQMAELNKAIYELCVDLLGQQGLLIDHYRRFAPTGTALDGMRDIRKSWLRSLANSIEGGTSEIQRTILGERVLGLPGEPKVDSGVPWKDTRRS